MFVQLQLKNHFVCTWTISYSACPRARFSDSWELIVIVWPGCSLEAFRCLSLLVYSYIQQSPCQCFWKWKAKRNKKYSKIRKKETPEWFVRLSFILHIVLYWKQIPNKEYSVFPLPTTLFQRIQINIVENINKTGTIGKNGNFRVFGTSFKWVWYKNLRRLRFGISQVFKNVSLVAQLNRCALGITINPQYFVI